MIEYVFSAVKRTLDGGTRSRRRDLMFSEVENKFWTWNEMRREELINYVAPTLCFSPIFKKN